MSARVAILTDSTSDLTPDLLEQAGVTSVPLTVTLDGSSYLDGVEIVASEFYQRIGASRSASTSQPAPGQFVAAYEKLLHDHDSVVSVHISARLSGTLESARQAADLVGGGRVHVVDSKTASMPLGLLALAAARSAAGGAAAGEVVSLLEGMRDHTNVYFTVPSLEFLRRGGRIGRAGAFLGSVLQVKPILAVRDGEVIGLERVRTWERALARMVELVRQAGDGQICAMVGHAGAPDVAERLEAELAPIAETLLIRPLGPVVDTHTGPGTVGVGFYPAALFPLGLREMAAAPGRR